MRKLRVVVLIHEGRLPPESIDHIPDEQLEPIKLEFDVISALQELGHEVFPVEIGDELSIIRRAIEDSQPHITFNLLTHFHHQAIYTSYVVSYLELLKVPYTGCNARGLLFADHKALSKKIMMWHRLPVPRFVLFRRGQTARKPKRLDFPLFVKSAAEHASLGVAQASIVRDVESLKSRVSFIHERVGTDALVEEYIEGRELYVTILGNRRLQACPLWELKFGSLPEGTQPVATRRVKWDEKYRKKLDVSLARVEDLSEPLVRRIESVSKRVYRALELSGYARIDLRLTPEGRFFVLEANPNADLSYGEVVAESAEAAGIQYELFVQKLITLGLRYSPAWKSGEQRSGLF
ncbi:MAG: D-alanine--D-alanine ligase [Acidobacteriota bacterium]|nr:MAG: D-alanine--D-alanine ligase [Acidobacteriota bacterium]